MSLILSSLLLLSVPLPDLCRKIAPIHQCPLHVSPLNRHQSTQFGCFESPEQRQPHFLIYHRLHTHTRARKNEQKKQKYGKKREKEERNKHENAVLYNTLCDIARIQLKVLNRREKKSTIKSPESWRNVTEKRRNGNCGLDCVIRCGEFGGNEHTHTKCTCGYVLYSLGVVSLGVMFT